MKSFLAFVLFFTYLFHCSTLTIEWPKRYGKAPNFGRYTGEVIPIITFRIINESAYIMKVWNPKEPLYFYELNPAEKLLFSAKGECCEGLYFTCAKEFPDQPTFEKECKIKFELITKSGPQEPDRFGCLKRFFCSE